MECRDHRLSANQSAIQRFNWSNKNNTCNNWPGIKPFSGKLFCSLRGMNNLSCCYVRSILFSRCGCRALLRLPGASRFDRLGLWDPGKLAVRGRCSRLVESNGNLPTWWEIILLNQGGKRHGRSNRRSQRRQVRIETIGLGEAEANFVLRRPGYGVRRTTYALDRSLKSQARGKPPHPRIVDSDK